MQSTLAEEQGSYQSFTPLGCCNVSITLELPELFFFAVVSICMFHNKSGKNENELKK